MLRIHEVKSSAQAKNYYLAASDYYSEGQEVVGRWGGKLAERLGLSGSVDKAGFERLCDNLHPTTGKALTLRTNEHHRVGYDFTFDGPKSFSFVEAMASEAERKKLLAAWDASVMETVAEEIEPDMLTRVRKNGADHDRKTGNLLFASFDHSTSRPVGDAPPDMHRHKHVLIFSATHDPVERRIKAGQFGDLKRDGEYYSAVAHAKLAAKLEAMGYAIDRKGGKAWEIAGLPQSLLEKFSKRTEQVETEAARLGITDAKEKSELGAKTRSKKNKELTPAQLRTAWGAQLVPAEREALAAVYQKKLPLSVPVTAKEATSHAILHASEQHSVTPEKELKRLALLRGLGHVLPEHLEREFKQAGVIVREFNGRRMATTKDLLAEESQIVAFAAQGRGTLRPIGVPESLKRGRLNEGQWNAVTGLLNSENRVNVLIGPAGSGKTSTLKKLDEGMRLSGQEITYLATTTDAADVLSKEGFHANTLAYFLLDERLQNSSRHGHIVLDESSLLGHKDTHRLFTLADKLDLKLTLLGDPRQHGSVSRGATLRVLTEHAGITPFRLSEILRQEDSGYREAATLLSEGRTIEGFDAIDGKGWIQEIGDEEERYRRIAADYLQAARDKASCLIVSPTHAEGSKITQEIRSQLRENGLIKGEDREYVRLIASNASEAERKLATTYKPGDIIQFHQNAKGYAKGQRLTVTDPTKVPLAESSKFSLYRPEKIALAEGDKLRFTATVKTPDGKHKLNNGAIQTVAGFTEAGNIRLTNGWIVAADAGHFRHGFVETSFGSQGRTVQRAILAVSSQSLAATNAEQMYVSSTRARQKMTLYTDDKAAVRSHIQKSSQKLAALDIQPPPQPKRWDGLKAYMDRKRRHGIINRLRAAWDTARQRPERQAGYSHAEQTRSRQAEGYSHGR